MKDLFNVVTITNNEGEYYVHSYVFSDKETAIKCLTKEYNDGKNLELEMNEEYPDEKVDENELFTEDVLDLNENKEEVGFFYYATKSMWAMGDLFAVTVDKYNWDAEY